MRAGILMLLAIRALLLAASAGVRWGVHRQLERL
jgi:hypothetical protein